MITALKHLFLVVLLLIATAPAPAQANSDTEIEKLNAELSTAYAARDYDKALIAANKLVELNTQRLGKDHIDVAKALKNRGFLEHLKGDDKHAENTLSAAMRIFKNQNDLSNVDAASFGSLLETLAKIKSQDKFEAGEGYLELALQMREKGNGGNSRDVAYVLANLGNRKYWHREFKPAADLYKRSLLILARLPSIPSETDRATVYA